MPHALWPAVPHTMHQPMTEFGHDVGLDPIDLGRIEHRFDETLQHPYDAIVLHNPITNGSGTLLIGQGLRTGQTFELLPGDVSL